MTAIPVSVSDLLSFEADPGSFFLAPGDTWDVTDTAANIEALTPGQISAALSVRVSAFTATDASLVLTAAQAAALADAQLGSSVPPADTVTIMDTAANVEALTPTEISALPSIGVSAITATGGSVALTIDQAVALGGTSLALSVPAGDTVSFTDTANNISALTPTQIAAISSAAATDGVTALAASNASVVLTVAEAQALEGAPFHVTAPPGDTVTIADTAANIQNLTPADITALPATGVTAITAIGSLVTLQPDQANALVAAKVGITTELTVAQALALEGAPSPTTLPAGEHVIVLDTAANLEALTPAQMAALNTIAVTPNGGNGVTAIAATDGPAVFTAAQMDALAGASVAVTAPPNDPGQNDGTTVIAGPSDGMTFDISWDPSVASAPAAFKIDVEHAFQFYADTFTDPTTLYYNVGYGEVGGGAMSSGDLGESSGFVAGSESYAALVAAMASNATSGVQAEAVASLPATDPTGGLSLFLTQAEAGVLGFGDASTSFADPDGNIGFSSAADFNYSPDPNQVPVGFPYPDPTNEYDLVGAVEHEISEVMGRVSYLGDVDSAGTGEYAPIDLFRYSAADTPQFSPTGSPSYFSIDGGVTSLGVWNNHGTGDGGDLADWAGPHSYPLTPANPYTPDSYNDTSFPDFVNPITTADVAVVNALGYGLASPTQTVTLPPTANVLFFEGVDSNGHDALWVSQGAAGDTHELTSVNSTAGDVVSATDITVLGAKALFNGADLLGNDGLWVSNGTATGTHEITGIDNTASAALGGLNPSELTVVGNQVWFEGTDASGKVGLWETDGTAAGTHELVPGVTAYDMTAANGGVVFQGTDGALWESNGTPQGTVEIGGAQGTSLGELAGESLVAPAGGLQPSGFAVVDGQLLFGGSAEYTYNGTTIDIQALFTVNGTSIQPISGIAPGDAHLQSTNLGQEFADTPGPIVSYTVSGINSGTAYAPTTEAFYQGDTFLADNSGGGLYAYDPATGSATLVYGSTPGLSSHQGFPDPTGLTSVDGFLVFNGANGEGGTGNDLYLSDGMPGDLISGTTETPNTIELGQYITDADASGLGLNPQYLTALDGNLYFAGSDAAGNQNLFELQTLNGSFYSPDSAGVDQFTASGFELTGIGGANSSGLDPTDLTAMYVPGPTALPVTVGELLVDLVNPSSNIAPAGEAYVVIDTAFDVESLTAPEITAGRGLGLAEIVATDGSVVLTAAQAVALEDPVPVSVPSGDTVTIIDSAADIEAMTPDQLAALAPIGVTAITAADSSVVLTVAQAIALEDPVFVNVPAGDTVTIADTAVNIESLTPAEITALPTIGVTAITATDGSVVLQPLQAQALAATSISVGVPAGDTVTTTHIDYLTAAQIEALTPTQITAIIANGYTMVAATDTSVVLSIEQALTLGDASLGVAAPPGDSVSFADTATHIEALTNGQIATLSGAAAADGATVLTATDASVVLTVSGALALEATPLLVTAPPHNTVTVADTSAAIQGLTPAQIAGLPAIGVSAISTSQSVTLSAAQSIALESASLPVNAAEVSIIDTAAHIEALTAAQITALSSLSVNLAPNLLVTDASVTLTVAQALALGGSLYVSVPYGDTVSIADTAANIQALTPAQIDALVPHWSAMTATGGSLVFTAAQAVALEGANPPFGNSPIDITFAAGGTISVVDTAANIEALSPTELGLLRASAITANDASVTLTVAQAQAIVPYLYISAPAGDTVTIADTAANIENFLASSPSDVSAVVQFNHLSSFVATDASVVLTVGEAEALEYANTNLDTTVTVTAPGHTVTIADTAANIEGMSAPQIEGLSAIGITAIAATDTSVTLTVNQALALLDPINISAPSGDTVTIDDTEAAINSLTPVEIAALPALGVGGIDVPNLLGPGTIAIQGGITLTVDGAVDQEQVINFSGTGGVLALGDPTHMAGTISGFAPTDAIDLTGAAYDGSATVNLLGNNVLEVTEASGTYDLQLDPNQYFINPTFAVTADQGTGTEITLAPTIISSDVAIGGGENVYGVTVVAGGELNVESGGTATGTVIDGGQQIVEVGGTAIDTVVNSGGLLDLGVGANTSGAITFGTVGGTLQIDDTNMPSAPIMGFASGDTIDLTAIGYDATSGSVDLEAGNVLQITENGNTYDLQLDPGQSFAGDYFYLAPDQGTGSAITENTVPCYCPGTLIRVPGGDTPVEDLAIGDLVVTSSGAARPIKWIGKRAYSGRFVLGRKDILPICVAAGALDENVPLRDLIISPRHALYLGGVLIEARDLVNGVSITQVKKIDRVEYFHIELESHDILLAEGTPAESFIDDDSRGMFQNGNEYLQLYPNPSTAPARYYAPRCSEGYAVEAVRQRIEARAGIGIGDAEPNHGLRGFVDVTAARHIAGWAQTIDYPEAPVCLDVLVAGRLVGQTLANRYRADLDRAGLGSGHHSFAFDLPEGVCNVGQTVEVRRSLDGKALAFTAASRTGFAQASSVER